MYKFSVRRFVLLLFTVLFFTGSVYAVNIKFCTPNQIAFILSDNNYLSQVGMCQTDSVFEVKNISAKACNMPRKLSLFAVFESGKLKLSVVSRGYFARVPDYNAARSSILLGPKQVAYTAVHALCDSKNFAKNQIIKRIELAYRGKVFLSPYKSIYSSRPYALYLTDRSAWLKMNNIVEPSRKGRSK